MSRFMNIYQEPVQEGVGQLLWNIAGHITLGPILKMYQLADQAYFDALSDEQKAAIKYVLDKKYEKYKKQGWSKDVSTHMITKSFSGYHWDKILAVKYEGYCILFFNDRKIAYLLLY